MEGGCLVFRHITSSGPLASRKSLIACFRSPCRSSSTCYWPSLQTRSPSLLVCKAASEPQRRKKTEKVDLPDFFEIDKDVAALDLVFESVEALKEARHYEVVFLVHEDRVDELPDVIQKVKDFIKERKGKIHRLNDWGLRKLAYKIQKAKRANYILMNLQIGAEEVNELNALLQRDERVIRHMVLSKKHAETADTVPPPEFSSLKDESDVDDEYDSEEEAESEVEDAEEQPEVEAEEAALAEA